MELKTQVQKVMKRKSIPAGQMFLYKVLLEAGPRGLAFDELVAAGDRSAGEVRSTLGALGNRVTQSIGEIPGQPIQLLIGKRTGARNEARYHLTPELSDFIRTTPDLEAVLRETPIDIFHRHTSQAGAFRWNDDKTGGGLHLFNRR